MTQIHLYAVQQANGGPIKFGLASSLKHRLSSLQTGNPDKLVMLAHMPIAHPIFEKKVHRALRRHRHRGEWFKDNHFVRRFVALMKEGSTLDDAIWEIGFAEELTDELHEGYRTSLRIANDRDRTHQEERRNLRERFHAIRRNRERLRKMSPVARVLLGQFFQRRRRASRGQ